MALSPLVPTNDPPVEAVYQRTVAPVVTLALIPTVPGPHRNPLVTLTTVGAVQELAQLAACTLFEPKFANGEAEKDPPGLVHIVPPGLLTVAPVKLTLPHTTKCPPF